MHATDTLILTSATPDLLLAVSIGLRGVEVLVTDDGSSLGSASGQVWCFVDWLLPAISGLELCRRLRDNPVTAAAHITLLIEDDDMDTRRRALRAGADDYLVGPLGAARLIERMRHARGSAQASGDPERLALGDITLDLAAHQMRHRGRPVFLRPNEFQLMAHFIANPDRVYSRASLIDRIGKVAMGIDERTVDVWIGRLRRSLAAHGVPDPLRTVRTLGYVLDTPRCG